MLEFLVGLTLGRMNGKEHTNCVSMHMGALTRKMTRRSDRASQWLSGEEAASSAEDMGLIPASGRSPGGGDGSPLRDSCLENPHGQRSLVGYGPWGHKKLDTT